MLINGYDYLYVTTNELDLILNDLGVNKIINN